MQIDVLISASQLDQAVRDILGRDVARSTLFEWRKHLGVSPPFKISHAQALAIFGQVVKAGVRLEDARSKTIQILREKGL